MDYSVIDPRIRDLCRAINQIDGFKTVSSCQGHYRPDAVEASTRSGPAGPYVIFSHPDPATDARVERMLGDLAAVVAELDAEAAYHGGAVVRQLYTTHDAERHGRSAYTVTHPYRERNVPGDWAEQLDGYGEAVELVLDDGGTRGLDAVTPDPTAEVGDVAYRASVIDFQEFTAEAFERGLAAGDTALIEAVERERDDILPLLEEAIQEPGVAGTGEGDL